MPRTAHAAKTRTASACRVTLCASGATPMPEILRNTSTPSPVRFTRSPIATPPVPASRSRFRAKCDAIRGLLKAVDQGLKVKGPASRPVVIHYRTYHVLDRRPLPDRRDGYEVMEVA